MRIHGGGAVIELSRVKPVQDAHGELGSESIVL